MARQCDCYEIKRYKEILANSGIGNALKNKKFENYKVWNEETKEMKVMATRYVERFSDNCGGIAFLGQTGAGKTHISSAIMNSLMDKNVMVLYMPYVEKIAELKNLNRCSETNEDYRKKIEKYKNVRVLMIDDLFKATVTQVDIRIMFEIINDRALMGMPTIFSSEYTVEQLAGIDEGLTGRIVEMCRSRIKNIKKDIKKNYRFNGFSEKIDT